MNEGRKIAANFRGIIDSTLREGAQFSQAKFSLQEQKKIFSYLEKIGLDYAEVGNPARAEIQRTITELVRTRKRGAVKILSHVRNHEDDVARAIEAGVDGVNILCTVDAERLQAMSLTFGEYLERLGRNIEAAKKIFLEVRVGVEDFFNQPAGRSLSAYALAESLGAERISAADTLGKTMGWDVAKRIRDLRGRFSSGIEVHFHNDLGHAVSNALAALKAGANWVSTTILGIGERTGITPLSSLLVNLYLIDARIAERYDLSLLTEAEAYVARLCRIKIPLHLMTSPTNGFAHKAGIHLDALMKFGPRKYELIPPHLIGNTRQIVLDPLISGRTRPEQVEEFQKRHGSRLRGGFPCS
ncbi:MAG: LeuA family protein [Acidobacteriota bacterium]